MNHLPSFTKSGFHLEDKPDRSPAPNKLKLSILQDVTHADVAVDKGHAQIWRKHVFIMGKSVWVYLWLVEVQSGG